MPLSQNGLELLKDLEGIEYEPYRDSAGLLTVGCGHLLTRDELSSGKIQCEDQIIRWKDGPLTDDEINSLLQEDVGWAEAAVDRAIQVGLTQNQFDSLVLFCFNIGANAFRESTLCKLLNEGNYTAVPDQMMRWCYAGGRVVRGLQTRRAREVALWNKE